MVKSPISRSRKNSAALAMSSRLTMTAQRLMSSLMCRRAKCLVLRTDNHKKAEAKMDKTAERTVLKVVLGLLVVVILSIGVFIVSAATSKNQEEDDLEEDENDMPITGSALEMASTAALDYIGQGRVTDTEIGDEDGYYEVEITLDDGSQVDVYLDENFNVIGHESDSE